ncbi:type II secretion system F family protein [Elusimicrobiota bacterium]
MQLSDTVLKAITWTFLIGATITFAWFVEEFLKIIMPKRVDTSLYKKRGAQKNDAASEISFTAASPVTSLDKINVRLQANPWIASSLEKIFHGMGQHPDYEPKKFLLMKEKFAGIFGVGVVAFSLWAEISINPGLILFGCVLGFFFPDFQAKGLIAKRHRAALANLPSFVDLLALTIESGLDYLNAMERILGTTFKGKGVLEEEIENIMREVQLGYPRRDALRHFAKRVDVQEIRSLVGLLIQSDELGTGLVELLRNFSTDMRGRRLGRAEEQAGKASTKMLGPLMIFIFPVIFALILAPFLSSAFKGGGMPF